jgi:hypothetical protein
MKRVKFFFILLLSLGLFLHSDEIRSSRLLDASGHPTQSLLKILNALDVPNNGTLDDIVRATQKHWIQSGKERWEFEEVAIKDPQNILGLLKETGCIDEIQTKENSYDYALLLGATAPRVETRLNFLIKEWNRGVRFKRLIFLTGQRMLDPKIETFPDHIKTETDMISFLYRQKDLPEGMRKIPLEIIDAPAHKLENGKMRRPNTKDTLVEWLKQNPAPGKCLFISNQPYVGYQDAVCRLELPDDFIIETIGPEADPSCTFAQYLDNLARWLFQLRLL